MRFCKFCGEQVQADVKFCNHCGGNLRESVETAQSAEGEVNDANRENLEQAMQADKEEAGRDSEYTVSNSEVPSASESSREAAAPDLEAHSDDKESSPPASSGASASTQVKKKSNPKFTIMLTSIITVAVLLIGGFLVGKSLTSVNHVLDEFEKAIQEKDTEKLSDILTVDHNELELSEESLKHFLQLFESQPSELTYLLNHLKEQAAYGSIITKMFPVDLIKDGKKFLFFDNYVLLVNPVYINVSTNYANTDIIINGEVLTTSDSEYFQGDVGPLIPGEYTVEAVHDAGFFHLSTEEKVIVNDPGFSRYVDLYLDGTDVSFDLFYHRYDSLKSVKLFINGKDTGWNLAENDRVGPLLTDGSLNASFEAELPWGTIRTNDIPINDSYIDFNLGNSDEFKQEMMDVIIKFNEEFVEAFATADMTKLTGASYYIVDLLIDEIIFYMFMELEYEGAFHGVDFYMDSFELSQNYDGLWNVSVDAIVYFEETLFERGDRPVPEQIEEELRYELVYDPQYKEWFVDDISLPGMMEEDKMERYKVDNPVVHTSNWAAIEEEILEEEWLEEEWFEDWEDGGLVE